MADLKLNPEIKHILLQRFHESTSGEIAAINAVSSMFCDGIKSYPANTRGVIDAILQLGKCLGMWAESIEDGIGNGNGGGDLCCLLPLTPNVDYESAGIIGDECGTEDCPPTPHPHPHDPTDPCCYGSSPDINPDHKYPVGGVECLAPDIYEYVNGGISGSYCAETGASPDCLVPSRVPYDNAGSIGCGNPNEIHWVDYYWPARPEWCNAGFTGHNCTECEDPSLYPHGGADVDCGVCRRGGVENYRPEDIEYNNAGTTGDNCPSTYGRPTCLLPEGDTNDCYDNSGLIGAGDPDTENYVDHYWPGRCEYANAGLIGTGCAIGGDEWVDALDPAVEKGECYTPFKSDFSNAGLIGGSWKCDVNKKPNQGEHWFTPRWELEYVNSGAMIIPDHLVTGEEVFGGVECWEPTAEDYTQCGFQSDSCADHDAAPLCLTPGRVEYENGGVVARITESRLNWWDHYLPNCPEYDNAGVTGTNCSPPDPEDCCELPCNELPLVPGECHTHECWLPESQSGWGECDFASGGLRTSRLCNVCEDCGNTDVSGEPSVVVSDVPPQEPCEGLLWFQPSRLELFVYYCDSDTCQWVPAATSLGGTGGAQAIVSDTPPAGARCGDLWHDSVRQEMRVFYDDGNTLQWVPVSLAKANSTETEALMRKEISELRQELNALKLAVAGKSPD